MGEKKKKQQRKQTCVSMYILGFYALNQKTVCTKATNKLPADGSVFTKKPAVYHTTRASIWGYK